MVAFLARAVFVALGLWVATTWVSGLIIDGPRDLILAGLVLGVVNAVIRPIAVILTLPMTLLSLGLFLLVINAGMVGLVAWLLPGMEVHGFWPAFWTAIIVSIVSMIGSWFIGSKNRVQINVRRF